MQDPKQQIVEIAKLIYARGLSDSAGGNISLRQGGLIYVSPRYMGSKYRYNISPEQISVVDNNYQVVKGPTELSREIRLHFAAYQHFPQIGSVIHAHPRWLMVYSVAGRNMQPVLEYTEKFGVTECIPATTMHSQELADEVIAIAQRRAKQLSKFALGVLLPKHGVAILGHSVDNAYDTLERLENNARCTLLSNLLPPEEDA